GRRSAALVGAAVLLVVLAGPAGATPTIIRETITTASTDSGLQHDCRAGVTGTITGTDVLTYQSVETAQGFHFVGTAVDTGRIDWSDGTYAIIYSIDHLSFNTGKGDVVFTTAHWDTGDNYAADGTFLFRVTFRSTEHFTVTKGDITRIEFERGH